MYLSSAFFSERATGPDATLRQSEGIELPIRENLLLRVSKSIASWNLWLCVAGRRRREPRGCAGGRLRRHVVPARPHAILCELASQHGAKCRAGGVALPIRSRIVQRRTISWIWRSPRDGAEVSDFNGLKKGLGSKCLIAFQSVSKRLPKPALKATKAEPRCQYCKLTGDGTHNCRLGAILS